MNSDPDMEEQIARAAFEDPPSDEVLRSRRSDALSHAWANLCLAVMTDPAGATDPTAVRKLFQTGASEYLSRMHYGHRSRH
jgi:hypothetical protein